ncbi:MAG: hypothetical protein IT371_16400 [Deltaproteobacteria bacterium]|nr:hypothetical protein [Deltaproteobacteria bacterium]
MRVRSVAALAVLLVFTGAVSAAPDRDKTTGSNPFGVRRAAPPWQASPRDRAGVPGSQPDQSRPPQRRLPSAARRLLEALRARLPERTATWLATPAADELVEHARELHLLSRNQVPTSRREVAALRRAIVAEELRLAQQADPRNTTALVHHVMRRFARAQGMQAEPLRVLFGFSRMIDVKTAVSAGFMRKMEEALLAQGVNKAELLARINRGRPAGKGPVDRLDDLMVELVREQVAGEGEPKPILVTTRLAREVQQTLSTGQNAVSVREATGGAPAFGSNLAQLFHQVVASFHSSGRLSRRQNDAFEPGVRIVTRESGPEGAAPLAVDPASGKPLSYGPRAKTKVNVIIQSPAGLDFGSFMGERQLTIDGKVYPCRTSAKVGRVVLSTEASFAPTFDPRLTKAELGALGKANDLFVLAGMHYLTSYAPERLARAGQRLRWQLGVMRAANPDLYVHYQYVKAKDPAKEAQVFRALQGRVDSISLNATELWELARNLDRQPLVPGRAPLAMPAQEEPAERKVAERPERIYELARFLLEAMALERVHIHGYEVDLIVTRRGSSERMSREGLAALGGRQLGLNKVVNPSGELRTRKDVWAVLPTLQASSFGAIQRFADGLVAEGRLSRSARDAAVRNGVFQDAKDGTWVSVTPTRQFHGSLPGGLISLGDTIDISTLLRSFRRGEGRHAAP